MVLPELPQVWVPEFIGATACVCAPPGDPLHMLSLRLSIFESSCLESSSPYHKFFEVVICVRETKKSDCYPPVVAAVRGLDVGR